MAGRRAGVKKEASVKNDPVQEPQAFDLDQELVDHGASKMMLNAKVVGIMKGIIAERNGEIPKGASTVANDLCEKLEDTSDMLMRQRERLEEENRELDEKMAALQRLIGSAETAVRDGQEKAEAIRAEFAKNDLTEIRNPANIEAQHVFSRSLQAAVKSFGDRDIPESVMSSMVQTASYMAYLSYQRPIPVPFGQQAAEK